MGSVLAAEGSAEGSAGPLTRFPLTLPLPEEAEEAEELTEMIECGRLLLRLSRSVDPQTE